MKVIGIGKADSLSRPKQILLEISDDEFANLVGHYSLYSNNCPSPTVGTEFQISELFGKAVILNYTKQSCQEIKDIAEKLIAALPKNLS